MTDLAATLLLIPCTSGKRGSGALDLAPRYLAQALSPEAAEVLAEGRRLAWDKRQTRLDLNSPPQAAASYYSGHPYKQQGFHELLAQRSREGLHCLIVSGGYGFVFPEEPIHSYEAHLPSHTRGVWRPRFQVILKDYISRHAINRIFATFSQRYATVVPNGLAPIEERVVPKFTQGVDEGSAYHEVPRMIGEAALGFLQHPNG